MLETWVVAVICITVSVIVSGLFLRKAHHDLMHSGVVPSGRVIAEARARMAELDACLRRDEGTSAQGLVGDIDSAGHEDAANSAYSKAA